MFGQIQHKEKLPILSVFQKPSRVVVVVFKRTCYQRKGTMVIFFSTVRVI
jgi:hypothetical protein